MSFPSAWRTGVRTLCELARAGLASHALPVALLLACVLTAIGIVAPDSMDRTDAFMMRMAYGFDESVTRYFRKQVVDAQIGPSGPPTINLVSLQPDAWSHYFRRSSPVPRLPLACLVRALDNALQTDMLRQDIPAVIAIDIDITPTRAGRVSPVPEELDCYQALMPGRYPEDASEAEVMTAALRPLIRRGHCIVSIALPRFEDVDRSPRDVFIRDLPGSLQGESPAGIAPCIGFASPLVVEVPHEAVFEYSTRLRDRGRPSPPPASNPAVALAMPAGPAVAATLPQDWCSLGRMVGTLLARHEPEHRVQSPACGGTPKTGEWPFMFGDVEANPGDYEQRRIDLGPALATITTTSVALRHERDGDMLKSLAKELVTLPPSDAYILSVDDGSTQDKFLVPVRSVRVPGAWVHAAVAQTEYRERTHRHREARPAIAFASGMLLDLTLALFAAKLLDMAIDRVLRVRDRVLRDCALFVAPLAVLLLAVLVEFLNLARHFASGEWHTPLWVLVGMVVHAYVEMVGKSAPVDHHPEPAHHGRGHPATGADRPQPPHAARHRRPGAPRIVGQLTWAWLIAWSIAAGSHPEWSRFDATGLALAVAAAGVGLGYWFLAGRVRYLPLPWRH